MNERTHKWWRDALGDFMANQTHGCDMDGLWIDMNEPSSFETNELKPWNWNFPDDQEKYPYFSLKCPANQYDDPPYRTSMTFRHSSILLSYYLIKLFPPNKRVYLFMTTRLYWQKKQG